MADRKTRQPDPDDGESSEAPVRKKKKKKKQSRSPVLLIAGIAGGAVVAVALLAALAWVVIKVVGGGPPAQPVTAWEKYSTEEQEFGFDYPAGWKAKGYGIHNKREIEVKGSGASITAKENLTGSLVGDIAGAGGRVVDDDHLPVVSVHELRKPRDLPNYQEGTGVTVQTRFGKARRSPYTDGSRRGYRATLLMRETALDVFCECRASDWETLRPAFERVIESLGPG